MRGTWRDLLTDYFNVYAEESRDRGLPLIRALAMQYPTDAEAAKVSDEFMLGDELLVAPIDAASDVAGCDALFLGASERVRWPQIRDALGTRPILTMSEMVGFARDGGMIALMDVDNRLRFDVNLKAVRKAGLSINTDALEQANMVHAQAASLLAP